MVYMALPQHCPTSLLLFQPAAQPMRAHRGRFGVAVASQKQTAEVLGGALSWEARAPPVLPVLPLDAAAYPPPQLWSTYGDLLEGCVQGGSLRRAVGEWGRAGASCMHACPMVRTRR